MVRTVGENTPIMGKQVANGSVELSPKFHNTVYGMCIDTYLH